MSVSPFEIQVRFADIDMMGHVNNSVYLSYFEMTRVHYLEKLLGRKWDYTREGFLLARNEIDYIKPLFLHEQPKIYLRTENLGNKSFTFTYEILVDGELRTKGLSVMVAFDSQSKTTIVIPEKMREAFLLLKKEQ
jgi:acyl-CoA thioester hydrolase